MSSSLPAGPLDTFWAWAVVRLSRDRDWSGSRWIMLDALECEEDSDSPRFTLRSTRGRVVALVMGLVVFEFGV